MTALPINIILLGDPAAGKATQSELLLKKFPLYDLDMGKELRRLERGSSAMAKSIRTINKGNLGPTEVVRAILRHHIEHVSMQKGILFDGNPKMVGEAKLVAKLLKEQGRRNPFVIYLSIPMHETVTRMMERGREDDTLEALKNRVKYYRTNIAEVVSFFRTKYDVKKINGLGTVDEVHERIMKAIKEFMRS